VELGERFRAAGHAVHLVGGSVRDALLGIVAKDLDLEVFGGAVASNRNDFLGAVDRISSIDLARIRAGQDLSRIPGAVSDLLRIAEPGSGVVGSGAAGLVFGKSGFGIAIGEVAYSAVYPTIDLVHVLPVSPATDPARAFANNTTGLSFAGLEAREARFSYATSFLAKTLLVGGTVRYIQGRTYFLRRGIFDEDVSDPVAISRRAFDENRRDSTKFAFDAGAMLNLGGKARVGLDRRVPAVIPTQVPCPSTPRRTPSNSQCGSSGHLRHSTRTGRRVRLGMGARIR